LNAPRLVGQIPMPPAHNVLCVAVQHVGEGL
jgi:hypothetical protein